MEKRRRALVSLKPEVYEIFANMAHASGMSISRCIGDWLESTADGAQFVSLKMEQLRRSPSVVMSDFHTYAESRPGEISDLYSEQIGGRAATPPARKRSADGRGGRPADAPSSNTGLKSPPQTAAKPRQRSV